MFLDLMIFILILCLGGFFLNIYFQLAKIEKSLTSLLERIETYLLNVYGEE
jgi:hypothetical protein